MDLTDNKWLDAQYSVIGSVLISPEIAPKVIHDTTESDYSGACRTVYAAIRRLFLAGSAVDVIAVANALGPEYQGFLKQLMTITPTAANIDLYISICREQSRVNALHDIAHQMISEESATGLRELVDKAASLTADRPGLRIVTMADALRSFFDRHTHERQYFTWPLPELNDYIYAEPGDFIVIGGYPSAGKSAWALQCAWHWARAHKVGFFSLETSSEKLFDRQMSAAFSLSMDSIKRNDLGDTDWERIASMTEAVTSRNLELIPAAGMTPADVRAITTMRGYEIIFVDYLQLLQGGGDNRTAQVTNISIALHTLAQSMGVMVVALSQLARQTDKSGRSDPDLSSLRESGQIEQDADLVMMISLAHKDQLDGNRNLRIRKNKEGMCPSMLLAFDGKYQTFTRATPSSAQSYARRKSQRTPVLCEHQSEQLTLLDDNTPVPFDEKKG